MTNNFSKNLKILRESLNLTQTQFASKLMSTRTTISAWENGKSEPSLDMLMYISKLFDISYEDLLL